MKKAILASVVTLLFINPVVRAEILIFDTSDSQFDAGVDNQGWWSDTLSNYDENDNYAIGIDPFSDSSHNFFSFDLSLLYLPVTSARLELTRFNYLSSAESETLGLFDVLTDAVTLNNNVGTSESIYDDLGSGISYGEFEILSDGLSTDVLSFELNAAAISDINAARGGWFSIGGALLSPSSPAGIFGSSQDGGEQRLVLEVIPEPGTLFLFGIGVLLVRRRSRIKA